MSKEVWERVEVSLWSYLHRSFHLPFDQKEDVMQELALRFFSKFPEKVTSSPELAYVYGRKAIFTIVADSASRVKTRRDSARSIRVCFKTKTSATAEKRMIAKDLLTFFLEGLNSRELKVIDAIIDGTPVPVIAEEMGWTENNYYSKVFRLRKKLARMMENSE